MKLVLNGMWTHPLEVRIVLSERNLRAMISKIEMRREGKFDSQRTITWFDDELGCYLVFQGETDEEHYADRKPPGEMHPMTEEDMLDA